MVIAELPGHAVTFIHRAEAWCWLAPRGASWCSWRGCRPLPAERRSTQRTLSSCRSPGYRSGCGRGYDNSAYVEASPQQRISNMFKALRNDDVLRTPRSRRSAFSSRASLIGDTIPSEVRRGSTRVAVQGSSDGHGLVILESSSGDRPDDIHCPPGASRIVRTVHS